MIFMKFSNKVLSELVFSHSRVCHSARCKNVEEKKNTFLHVALAKCKKQQQQNTKIKKKV